MVGLRQSLTGSHAPCDVEADHRSMAEGVAREATVVEEGRQLAPRGCGIDAARREKRRRCRPSSGPQRSIDDRNDAALRGAEWCAHESIGVEDQGPW